MERVNIGNTGDGIKFNKRGYFYENVGQSSSSVADVEECEAMSSLLSGHIKY